MSQKVVHRERTKSDARILFVSTQMEAGGVQILSTAMLKALRAEGIEASLLFLYRKRPVFDGVEGVHSLLDRPVRTPLEFLLIVWRLFVFVRRYRPSAIVGWAHYSSPLAAIAGLLAGVPMRVGTQTNPPYSYSLPGRVLDWLCGTLGLYTSNVAASHFIEDCFSDYPASYRRALTTVYNGIQPFAPTVPRREARTHFGLDEGAFLIINCGRLSKQKNQSFLLEVLELVPDARLAILGEGELRGQLQEEIARRGLTDRVTLVGEVPPERVADFLQSGDIFAFPSLYEAFGLAVAEAMLAGLPVVSSDHPALAEVVGDAGILLPIDDPIPWAEAIGRLRSDADVRERASKASAERATQFSFERMLSGFKAEML